MKNLLYITIALILTLNSCNEKEKDSISGTVEFAFSVPGSKLKSLNQSDSTDIVFALVTIQDKSGNYVYANQKLTLYKIAGDYITDPLSLEAGDYSLTGFLISNTTNVITFASPVKGAPLGYLVEKPLPISFTVGKDQVIKLAPEVISSENGTNATDFGYSTFSFSVASTFKIYVAAFEYSSFTKNYELTDATLKITFEGDTSNITLPLSNITNQIILPERQIRYTLTAIKGNNNPISYSFSLDSLKSYQTKPLKFIFGINDNPLVAYYPMNGNAMDYSGHNNHGTVYGASITSGVEGRDSAYKFDGIDDYIVVPNSSSLNPTTQITVSAWYKTTSFVGSGNDGMVSKGYLKHVEPYYQYHLGVCGDSYWSGQSGFGFNLSLNGKYKGVSTGSHFYELNTWYHVVGTYDGNYMKLYVNGKLISSAKETGTMTDYGKDLYIGRTENRSDYYNTYFFLPGTIDDVRIYSEALSADEILNLYQASK